MFLFTNYYFNRFDVFCFTTGSQLHKAEFRNYSPFPKFHFGSEFPLYQKHAVLALALGFESRRESGKEKVNH